MNSGDLPVVPFWEVIGISLGLAALFLFLTLILTYLIFRRSKKTKQLEKYILHGGRHLLEEQLSEWTTQQAQQAQQEQQEQQQQEDFLMEAEDSEKGWWSWGQWVRKKDIEKLRKKMKKKEKKGKGIVGVFGGLSASWAGNSNAGNLAGSGAWAAERFSEDIRTRFSEDYRRRYSEDVRRRRTDEYT